MSVKQNWYAKLVHDPEDLSPIMDAYDYYMEQYHEGVKEINDLVKRGSKLESAVLKIPGISGYRMAQLNEIEQIVCFLDNRQKRLLGQKRRHYREHYQRELTDSMVEKYAETEPEYIDLLEISNMFCLVRNKYLSLTGNHERLHYQLNNLTKLREKGIEDTLL